MKKRRLSLFVAIIISIAMLAGMTMFATGCGGGPSVYMDVTVGTPGNTAVIALDEGYNLQINMLIAGEDAGRVDWESGNPTVATIRNGRVTPVAVGRSVITATARATGVATTITVDVVTSATGIQFEHQNFEAAATTTNQTGGTINRAVGRSLAVTSRFMSGVAATTIANSAVRVWESSNPAVVTVGTSGAAIVGNLNLLSVGTSTITVRAANGNVQGSFTVNVGARQAGGISLVSEFFEMNDDLAGYYFLENNLDFSAFSFFEPGHGIHMIGGPAVGGPFTGTFDGRGFTMSGIYASVPYQGDWAWGRGLFHQTSGATIQNVAITNTTWFSNTGQAGVLIGTATDTTVENVFIQAEGLWGYWGNRGAWDRPAGVIGIINGTTTLNNVVADVTSLWASPIGGVAVTVNGSAAEVNNVFVTGTPNEAGYASIPQVWVDSVSAAVSAGHVQHLAPFTVEVTEAQADILQASTSASVVSVDYAAGEWTATIMVLHGYVMQRDSDYAAGVWGAAVAISALTLTEEANRIVDVIVFEHYMDLYEAGEIPNPPVISPGFGPADYNNWLVWNNGSPGNIRIGGLSSRYDVSIEVLQAAGSGFVPGVNFLVGAPGSVNNLHSFARDDIGAQDFSALTAGNPWWNVQAGQLPRLNPIGGLPAWLA